MFNEVHLIGVGLINGSLALDMKRLKLANKIIGIGRNQQRLIKAQSSNIIDSYQLLDVIDISNSDLVVIGVPVSKFREIFSLINPSLSPKTLVTDVGSTKQNIIQDAREVFNKILPNFVPGHPIAGSEQSGFEYAMEELFKNRKVILTPTKQTEITAVQKIKKLWQCVGAEVNEMTADKHDAILSATSHLPHMVAYTLVNYLSGRLDSDELFRYAAGGFYDFTRIASSDPTMWADICIANRDRLLESIDGFSECLKELRHTIDNQDYEAVHDLLNQAKVIRDENHLKK